jgi:predicted RNase H-like HicB family nuclease/predicted HTH domain antitoxin
MDEYEIIVDRLYEFTRNNNPWYGCGTISIDDIENGIKKGIEPINYQYQENMPYELDYTYDIIDEDIKNWHIGRIIYFIVNPDKIDAISISDLNFNELSAFIDDGNHRFLAKVYLKHKTIKAFYSGRIDLLDYLTGKTDKLILDEEREECDMTNYKELPFRFNATPMFGENGILEWGVEFPDLPGCVGGGNTIEEAIEMAMDAKQGWIEIAVQDCKQIPCPFILSAMREMKIEHGDVNDIERALLKLQSEQTNKLINEMVSINLNLGKSMEDTLFELYQKDIVSMGGVKNYLNINQYEFFDMLRERGLSLTPSPLLEDEMQEQRDASKKMFNRENNI